MTITVRAVSAAAALLCAAASCAAANQTNAATHGSTVALVAGHLATPPDDSRAMVRWWWFGPSLVNAQLEREMLAMKAGGFGGFEIQPVYPMELDDPVRGIRNIPYMSREFLDTVGFVNKKANALKLRVDMTLASGWPYGGPHVPVGQASGRLRLSVAALPAGASSATAPAIMSGEKLLATFIAEGSS
jgi:hypothetical protein